MACTGGECSAAAWGGRAYTPPVLACPPVPLPELSTWNVLLEVACVAAAALSGLTGTDDDDGGMLPIPRWTINKFVTRDTSK
jgi:hypothetical protein